MSPAELAAIIAFLKRSKQTQLGILGGEPTLHPHFNQMIKLLLGQGFKPSIFSNGQMKKGVADFLAKNASKRIELVVNIHHPSSYQEREWAQISYVLKRLPKITNLGFNIYKENFNAGFMIRLIKRYGLCKKVRLGIANPLLGENNIYLSSGKHKGIIQRIVRFARACDAEDVMVQFDCGFTLCSFSRKQIGELCYLNAAPSFHCQGPIDVGPGLEVWRCFATSSLWVRKLSEFKNLSEIRNFYQKKFEPFRQIGSQKSCLNCKYLRRRQCGGGCLTYPLKSFKMDRIL